MQPASGNADLRAKPEFTPIGELARGVDHDDRAIDFAQETFGYALVGGDDGIGVMRGMPGDMFERGIEIIDHCYRQDRFEIFGVPVLLR